MAASLPAPNRARRRSRERAGDRHRAISDGDAGAMLEGFAAIGVVGAISMTIAFLAFRGRVRRG